MFFLVLLSTNIGSSTGSSDGSLVRTRDNSNERVTSTTEQYERRKKDMGCGKVRLKVDFKVECELILLCLIKPLR